MNEDRCVCCGRYVPEGTMICWTCSQLLDEDTLQTEGMLLLGMGHIAVYEKCEDENRIDKNG